MSEDRPKGNYISQAWLVILLGLLYGGALAGVHTTLAGRIEANRKAEIYRVIPRLVPGGDPEATEEIIVEGESGRESLVYKVRGEGDRHVGWLLPASGSGFNDRIELVIGLDRMATTISGIHVIEQKETPGLGDNITTSEFREQFESKPTEQALVVVRTDPEKPTEVRALTGATISSESVAGIVNAGVREYRKALADLAMKERPVGIESGE